MKTKFVIILTINIMLTQILANYTIEKKRNSLDEIEVQINNLEGELKKQIQTQKGASEKLKEIQIQITNEKNDLLKNQDEEKYQLQLLKNLNYVIDSLKNNSTITQNEKNNTKTLIKEIKINNEFSTNQILTLNENLININNIIDNTLNELSSIKTTIKNIIQETIFISAPNDLEFIIESSTWDNFILHTIMYDMIIDEKKELIDELFETQEKLNNEYKQNLKLQNTMINNKKELNQKLEQYKELENRLNNNLIMIEKTLKEKELIYNDIIKEYKIISENLNTSKNKINVLKQEKYDIQNIQKKADNEKQRIEYALILKKESRYKVEEEIKKLLLKTSKYKGTNITHLKNKLPWPINGELISQFGINVSPTGTKFDYSFIEIVGNKIFYLVNEINPKEPNENLVKQFQRLTMNLKEGDTGYGVFGPQTTKKWKEYNNKKSTEKGKQPIIAIHEGKVEQIKFIDPITGVLIIIRHNNESLSTYSGHIDLIVTENDIVLSGQKIGLIKEENILAFQLVVKGNLVNPINWLIRK